MRNCSLASALLLAASASAQTGNSIPGGGTSGAYTFEMRLIADGDVGAPSGPGTTYPIGDVMSGSATRVGFWLQARVAQTAGENWGVVRASSPSGGTSTSYIAVSDPAGNSVLSRGSTNSANTNFGRGAGYRNGGPTSGQTDNPSGSAPFPGRVLNENGALDNGGAGAIMTRIYGFDSFVGGVRDPVDWDDPHHQPWRVNGASNEGSTADGAPVPADGTFSPWANLYRIWVDITSTAGRDITVNASALLNGAIRAAAADPSAGVWAMHVAINNGVIAMASYTIPLGIPTPGAPVVLVVSGLVAMRRRR